MNIFKLYKYLRFKPFDASTEAGRSHERYRLALWSFLANILSKLMALAVMMLSIRWTLPYLGEERFGIWMTVSSFATMLVVLDLGIGNALTTHTAHAAAHDKPETLKSTISGSLGFLFLVSLSMGFLLTVAATFLPLHEVLKIKDQSLQPELQSALIIFAILFGINLFGSGVQKLFSGLQRTFEGLIASAACSFLALIGVAWAAHLQASIPVLLITTFGIQSLGGIVLFALLIKRKQFTFTHIGDRIKEQYQVLFKNGSMFFLIQLGALFGPGADSIIISSTLGVAAVAAYSIAHRLFQLCTMSVYMLNGPLWGAYADAHARQDKTFLRLTFFRSLRVTTVLSLLIIAVLLLFNPWILRIWLNNRIEIPLSLLLAFAAWTFFECLGGSITIFLNGMQLIKPQIISMFIFISISLALKLGFIHHYGLIVVPLATVIAAIVAKIFLYRFVYYQDIKSQWQ